MRRDEIAGEKRREANHAAKHQGTIRDQFRDRPRNRNSQDEQRQRDCQAKHHKRMEQQVLTERTPLRDQTECRAAQRDQRIPKPHSKRPTGGVPVGHHFARLSPAHIFTPFSVKYFVAPGCHGIGEFFGA